MTSRAEELANQLEQVMQRFTEVVGQWPDDKWTTAHGEEGWTVAATAQHVSGQFPLEMEYITAAAEGRPLPSYTWDDVNGKNDTRAAENTTTSKADVLAELREKGSSAAAYVRGLSDEQLDRVSELPLANSAQLTTEQLIQSGLLIDHLRAHTKSIESAG